MKETTATVCDLLNCCKLLLNKHVCKTDVPSSIGISQYYKGIQHEDNLGNYVYCCIIKPNYYLPGPIKFFYVRSCLSMYFWQHTDIYVEK